MKNIKKKRDVFLISILDVIGLRSERKQQLRFKKYMDLSITYNTLIFI